MPEAPELTPDVKRKYKFDARFLDDMMRVSWDTAATYAAKGCILIATRYSGEAGARRLREQGYAPEMIEMMKGAGVRCFKHRAGMPVLGIIGKMMNTRFNGGVLPLARFLDSQGGCRIGHRAASTIRTTPGTATRTRRIPGGTARRTATSTSPTCASPS